MLNFKEIIKVETITLNTFFKQHSIQLIDFVHMDVQGAELKVLMGAQNKLEAIKAIWLEVADIEIYKDQVLRPDIEKFMKSQNFKLIKSAMHGKVGDQFYINKRFFQVYSILKWKFFLKRNRHRTN